MTREEKLVSMRMQDLVKVAENLGIKINSKAAKSQAVEKILKAEAEKEVAEVMDQKKDLGIECPKIESYEVVEENLVPMPGAEKLEDLKKSVETKPKNPNYINLKLKEATYKGETKLIKDWATEIGIPWSTLYNRINRGWPVEKAMETPLRKKKK